MRIVFMGTPDFAAVALNKIQEAFPGEIVGVVSRMDTPKNRGHVMTPPPVKVAAEALGLPVYQPRNLKEENFKEKLTEWNPDIIVVAAYGRILPKYVLDYPKYGCINIHGSLLPKYRGAAPIQRAIMDLEKEIGITVMKMAEGLDTGDMYEKAGFAISDDDTFETIHDRLANMGGDLVIKVMKDIVAGTAKAEKQDDSLSNYAAKIEKEERILRFDEDGEHLFRRIMAFSPLPGVEAELPSGKVKITSAKLLREAPDGDVGTVSELSNKGEGKLIINLKDAKLQILRIIPQGKKEMSAGDFVRGRRITETDRFMVGDHT